MLLFKKMTLFRQPAIFTLLISLFFLTTVATTQAFGADKQSRKLWDALTYLKSVPEIAWIEVDDSHIILGWKGYSPNFSTINRTVAKKASRKVRGDVKVYSVKENLKGWRPKKDAPAHLCYSLGKGGRLQFTNCH